MVGCGSQNLGPLEDKTTKLRDQNHNLKLDIQLNQDISNQKHKLRLLIKIKNVSKTVDNNKEAKFLDASSNIIKILLKLLVIIISWICLKIRKKTKSKILKN